MIIWDDQNTAMQPASAQQPRIVWDDEPGAGLHQAVQQLTQSEEGRWLKDANTEIDWRERGITLEKIDNGDGTFSYQQRQGTPRKLPNSEKQAILDAYRMASVYAPKGPEFGQATRENLESVRNQFARADYEEAQKQGAVRNFVKGTTNTVAQLPAGIIDAVSGFANRINRNQGLNEYVPGTVSEALNQFYNYNPESVSGFAGMVTGNAIPMLPGVGAAGMGAKAASETLGRAYLGAGAISQFGNVVADVAKRRDAGENISDSQMYTAAILSAAAEILGEKLGLDSITRAVGGNPALGKSLAKRAVGLLESAGVNATEEGATQVMQNFVQGQFIDPNQMLTEGVGTAMAAGGATGGTVPLIGRAMQRFQGETKTPTRPYGLAGPTDQLQEAPYPGDIPVEPHGYMNAVPVAEPRVGADGNPIPLVPETPAPSPKAFTEGGTQGEILPPLLRGRTFSFRVNEGAESRGVNLEFESNVDKALYALAQPRHGKVQAEARTYLQNIGLTPARIAAVKSKFVCKRGGLG